MSFLTNSPVQNARRALSDVLDTSGDSSPVSTSHILLCKSVDVPKGTCLRTIAVRMLVGHPTRSSTETDPRSSRDF